MAIIAAVYNRALKDYERAFLRLKKLEFEGGHEAEKAKCLEKMDEAEAFMLTGGGYAVPSETSEKIAACFKVFKQILETM